MSTFNKELNVVFIHVPKTAGTSMEHALFYPSGGHETIREFPQTDGAFKFAFVRNPWDRFVSAFFCHPQNTSANFLNGFSMDKDGFNKYIDFCSRKFPGEYPEYGVHRSHFIPMYHFLLNDDGEIGVDFVGRFENLQSDWQYVCSQIGVKVPVLEYYRKIYHRPYKEYYTPKTWDIVADLYNRDIALFDYYGDYLPLSLLETYA